MSKGRLDQLKEAISKEIVAFLDEEEMSQREFARKLDIDPANVTRMVNCERNFTLETLVEIERIIHKKIVKIERH